MPRTVAEIDADLASLKASGADMRGKPAQVLRAEMKALVPPPSSPSSSSSSSSPPDDPAPVVPFSIPASDDVAFVNDALAQLLLKGHGAGKVEKSYSDIRSLLDVKHILEDAAGLVPTGRISLPHWDTLGRDRDSGLRFKAGENQMVVDGLAQRAVPPRPAPKGATVGITDRAGQPLSFGRTRLNEPDGAAEFLNADEAEAVATSK